jgi:hypothetical protein
VPMAMDARRRNFETEGRVPTTREGEVAMYMYFTP